MILRLLKFEFLYQRKHWALLLGTVLFFLAGLQVGSQGFALDLVNFNAPYQISYNTAIFTLGSVFVIMFFAVSGVLRDQVYRTQSIIFSSGIRKPSFFVSRFTGVFIFSLLAFSPLLIGMITGTHLFELDPDRLAPFSMAPYFWNWLVFILPNIFTCSVIIFSASLLTRSTLATYASAILVYVLYFAASFYFDSPVLADSTPAHIDNTLYAALADPFGIAPFLEQSRYWTPQQKNEILVSLSGGFLYNRLLWIGISLVVLSISYRLFSFRPVTRSTKKTKKQNREFEAETAPLYMNPVNTLPHSIKAFLKQFRSQAKTGIMQLFKSIPFWFVMLLWVLVISSEVYANIYRGGSYTESLYPSAAILLNFFEQPLFILGLLLVIFYSGEWIWKERSSNFHLILDATPASVTGTFFSKLLVLLFIPFLLITLGIFIVLGFQVTAGYPDIQILPLLSLYYFQGMRLVFYILLVFFFQTLLPNKYLGMLVTGLTAIIFGSSLSASLGIEHPLLRIGAMPSVTYTDMTGYGNFAFPFAVMNSHWIILGLILTTGTLKMWKRGTEPDFRSTLKKLMSSWSAKQKLITVSLLSLFILSTGFIFYHTNIEQEYLSTKNILDRRADYEKRYKSFEETEQLYPVSIFTDVAIFPEKKSYTVDAEYLLINKGDKPVSEMLITERIPLLSLELEGASMAEHNPELGTYVFHFIHLVNPGDSVQFSFSLKKETPLPDADLDVVNNGSYIHLRDFSPTLGYNQSREIRGNVERKIRGLPSQTNIQQTEADLRTPEPGYGRIQFETLLSTSASQTGIAVGSLVDQWTEGNRNYYHFKTEKPVMPGITYLSARYKKQVENYMGIQIEQYVHPQHDFNLSLIQSSAKATLDYATEEFGEYPYDHLRIAEIPSHWRFGGYAAPGSISMVADNLYLVDERNPEAFSLVAKRTIHEVAHQWWGHVLSPRSKDGSGIFVEGFAKYTEAVLMEKLYGKPALFQLSQNANDRYFTGRSYANEPEQPLYLEQGEGYMLYGKSYISMLALKELVGEKEINRILRKLLYKYAGKRDSDLTSLDFMNELYSSSPDSIHSLIDDWFKKIVTYDLSVGDLSVLRNADSSYTLTFTIHAQKSEWKNGKEVPVALNELIPIALLSDHPSSASEEQILYLNPEPIKTGSNQITLTVNKLPSYVTIDPYGTRPDYVRSDNWKRVD